MCQKRRTGLQRVNKLNFDNIRKYQKKQQFFANSYKKFDTDKFL